MKRSLYFFTVCLAAIIYARSSDASWLTNLISRLRPSEPCKAALTLTGPIEITEDTLYQDVLRAPVNPRRWLLEKRTGGPKTEEELEADLARIFADAVLFSRLRTEKKAPNDWVYDIQNFLTTMPGDLSSFMNSLRRDQPELHAAVFKLVELMGQNSPEMNEYLYELGYLLSQKEENPEPNGTKQFPEVESLSGEFWDLATGLTSLTAVTHELNPKVHYKLFDISPFVVGSLNGLIVKNKLNAEAIQADARKLPNLDRPVSVIRMKNLWTYVRDFEKYIAVYADLLSPDGALIFQDSKFMPNNLVRMLNATYREGVRLLQRGWTLTYDMEEGRGFGMYRISLYKPSGRANRLSEREAQNLWDKMVRATNPRLKIKFVDGRYK